MRLWYGNDTHGGEYHSDLPVPPVEQRRHYHGPVHVKREAGRVVDYYIDPEPAPPQFNTPVVGRKRRTVVPTEAQCESCGQPYMRQVSKNCPACRTIKQRGQTKQWRAANPDHWRTKR